MEQQDKFWQTKSLAEMNEAEWESLCDGCGLCCYRKFIVDEADGGEKLYFSRIACNQLDLKSGRCRNYAKRFIVERDCTKLTKDDLAEFEWLPKTCAYRLIYEGQQLPDWHPLISGDITAVQRAGIQISNGVYEDDVIDWFDFVIED